MKKPMPMYKMIYDDVNHKLVVMKQEFVEALQMERTPDGSYDPIIGERNRIASQIFFRKYGINI